MIISIAEPDVVPPVDQQATKIMCPSFPPMFTVFPDNCETKPPMLKYNIVAVSSAKTLSPDKYRVPIMAGPLLLL